MCLRGSWSLLLLSGDVHRRSFLQLRSLPFPQNHETGLCSAQKIVHLFGQNLPLPARLHRGNHTLPLEVSQVRHDESRLRQRRSPVRQHRRRQTHHTNHSTRNDDVKLQPLRFHLLCSPVALPGVCVLPLLPQLLKHLRRVIQAVHQHVPGPTAGLIHGFPEEPRAASDVEDPDDPLFPDALLSPDLLSTAHDPASHARLPTRV
mmetsp:Transcript_37710/g.74155  ORF Transcript_37710/g.74155 Transcript_37710/m.74155 type:complete len:204 (-) Transcript_37710:312-923(-)